MNTSPNIDEISSDDDGEPAINISTIVRCPGPDIRLTDNDIMPALTMLKRQFLNIGGLVDTLYFESKVLDKAALNIKNTNVYIVLVYKNHWVVIFYITFKILQIFKLILPLDYIDRFQSPCNWKMAIIRFVEWSVAFEITSKNT